MQGPEILQELWQGPGKHQEGSTAHQPGQATGATPRPSVSTKLLSWTPQPFPAGLKSPGQRLDSLSTFSPVTKPCLLLPDLATSLGSLTHFVIALIIMAGRKPSALLALAGPGCNYQECHHQPLHPLLLLFADTQVTSFPFHTTADAGSSWVIIPARYSPKIPPSGCKGRGYLQSTLLTHSLLQCKGEIGVKPTQTPALCI